ncbi:uncharacterized protein LOC118768579 isoform X1 [Octopus sinensis]|uniref:Uncharacterized protein LOC118768579 isoform X1 n=1 Tax=Octopus sinensis TaxID=2607531 RepID=A0A7E6FU90_9MOLL|nr:uncharacterized protein LOC118768579 isoform X1 [Octopus sinensis]
MSQFLSNCPAAMAVLLLTLTTFLAVTSDQELHGYYKSLGPGYTYAYLQASPAQEFFSTRNLFDCTALAQRSQSQFFTYNKVSHICKNYSSNNFMTVVSTNDTKEISFFKNGQWIKVYALSMRAGSKVYDSFMNIELPSTWNVDKCNGTFCPNFFRHPILDFWRHLPIDEVKLVIYKNKTDVVTIIFDGRNTTLQSWFSHEKLKNSPWNDLASATGVQLSIEGFGHVRRFYITLHGFCEGDRGWLTINEGPLDCQYEKSDHYPSIRYSDTKSKVIWNNSYALADSMAIFIRLRQQN